MLTAAPLVLPNSAWVTLYSSFSKIISVKDYNCHMFIEHTCAEVGTTFRCKKVNQMACSIYIVPFEDSMMDAIITTKDRKTEKMSQFKNQGNISTVSK